MMRKIGLFILAVVGSLAVGTSGMVGAVEMGEAEDGTVTLPEIYIKAINPGYTVDGKNNVGEMIEFGRGGSSDAPISLAGITIGYINSSGNYSILMEFPEYSWLTGETLLLRLASSPGSELAAANYTKTLAFKAGLVLKRGEEILDEVCWTGKEGCYKEFKSASPTTLVWDLETGKFEHVTEYAPVYDAESYKIETEKEEEGYGATIGQCKNVIFTEVLSYYESTQAEQFIELYNNGAEQALLDGCQIRYKNKTYALTGVLKAEEYKTYYPSEFSLTKNPTSSNKIDLVDTDGAVVDSLEYPNGQRKGTSYALIGYDASGEEIWRVTYAPTPGEANNYQEYKTCEAGKVINEVTGNCVKVVEVTEKICGEGQYLNLLTGRCKKYETAAEKTCKEGYYLNPDTGRCRKVMENTGADYNLAPESYEEESSFVALYAVLGVLGVGLVYLIYEFRHEIWKLWRKVWRRFR